MGFSSDYHSKTMRFFYIFLLFEVANGNSVNRCRMRNGARGFCVSISNCEMVKELTVLYEDQFCNGNLNIFCCDRDYSFNSVRLATTTYVPYETASTQTASFEEHPNFSHFSSKECGVIEHSMRIAHGRRAQLLEFPFAALIGYESDVIDSYDFACGGSLISGKSIFSTT